MGNVARDFQIANEFSDKNLISQIAGACVKMKTWTEAMKLYHNGGIIEKAASKYIQMGIFKLADPFIEKITSPNILCMVTKAKEKYKLYREAERLMRE